MMVVLFSMLMGACLAVLATETLKMRWLSGRYREMGDREKWDHDRFAVLVLISKARVASVLAQEHMKLAPGNPEVRADLMKLYEDVARTWIPEDADPTLHELKAKAREAARAGRPVVLH